MHCFTQLIKYSVLFCSVALKDESNQYAFFYTTVAETKVEIEKSNFSKSFY